MKQLSKLSIAVAILFMICLAPSISFAQALNPGDPCTDPDEYCPIDGGVVALLAAGVGYGIKKVRDSRQKSVDPE